MGFAINIDRLLGATIYAALMFWVAVVEVVIVGLNIQFWFAALATLFIIGVFSVKLWGSQLTRGYMMFSGLYFVLELVVFGLYGSGVERMSDVKMLLPLAFICTITAFIMHRQSSDWRSAIERRVELEKNIEK